MLSDLTYSQMLDYAKALGLPKFRGEQIFDAIYNGKAIDEITNLPKSLLEVIEKDYPKQKIYKCFTAKDGTRKYIIALQDNNIVECVLMKYKYGYTLCVSTQVGCRMGCKFCASTLNGLVRNLSAGEILGQVLLINRDLGGGKNKRKITNIVMMGSGEPLDNFENVCLFIDLISSEKGLNVSQRNISLSTCGLVDKIKLLEKRDYNITLTISLHASEDKTRQEIMPIANRYSIEEIVASCKEYYAKTGRRIYFEYTLVEGKNDREKDVENLSKLLKGLNCHINVIPLNEVKERSLKGSSRDKVYEFCKKLTDAGLSSTVRRTMGQEIGGACGQLRNSLLKKGL